MTRMGLARAALEQFHGDRIRVHIAIPFTALYPALHLQSVTLSLPGGDDEPDRHDRQASDPFTALYLPASHAAHVSPSGPVYPALHLQSVTLLLEGSEVDPDGHATHVSLDAEVLSWNVPA